jgi:TRAP-type C4-dicarboxylate transport system permease small subunit
MRWILRFHDALTDVGFWGAALAVAYLTLVTAWEVFGRYALDAPSDWAPDTAAVSFAMITFLAAPKVTRSASHARMSFIVDGLPPAAARWINRCVLALGLAICALCAWFGAVETLRQIERDVTIISVTQIPKWLVTGAITYGLASMGLYFLRQFAASFAADGASDGPSAHSGGAG